MNIHAIFPRCTALLKRAACVLIALLLLPSLFGCGSGTVAAAPPALPSASIPEELVDTPAFSPAPTPAFSPAPAPAPTADPPATPDTPAVDVLPLRALDADKPMVALTFDDGPHKTYTGSILDVLEQYDVVATFFELGNLVEKYPETVRRASELGCEIASHTYSHKDLTTLTDEELAAEIQKADDAIIAAAGVRPTLLRPPYGKISENVRNKANHPIILWSVDTKDWENRDAEKTFQAIKDEGDLNGKVILMHSIRESTAEAMAKIVPWLIENGYQLVTVSEMIEIGMGDTPENGKKYGYSYFRR